jgi:predicted dehydrogenase
MAAMNTDDEPQTTDIVKVSVLGTGSLGKEHVRIYSELAAAGKVEFAGVYDTVAETAQRLAQKYGVRAFGSVA